VHDDDLVGAAVDGAGVCQVFGDRFPQLREADGHATVEMRCRNLPRGAAELTPPELAGKVVERGRSVPEIDGDRGCDGRPRGWRQRHETLAPA
jgi:hypothetical protein